MFHIDLVYKAYPLNMQSCKNDANLVGSNFIITSDGWGGMKKFWPFLSDASTSYNIWPFFN